MGCCDSKQAATGALPPTSGTDYEDSYRVPLLGAEQPSASSGARDGVASARRPVVSTTGQTLTRLPPRPTRPSTRASDAAEKTTGECSCDIGTPVALTRNPAGGVCPNGRRR